MANEPSWWRLSNAAQRVRAGKPVEPADRHFVALQLEAIVERQAFGIKKGRGRRVSAPWKVVRIALRLMEGEGASQKLAIIAAFGDSCTAKQRDTIGRMIRKYLNDASGVPAQIQLSPGEYEAARKRFHSGQK